MTTHTFTPCEPPPQPELSEASKLAQELLDTIGSEMQPSADRIALCERWEQLCYEVEYGEEIFTPDGIWCIVAGRSNDHPLLTEDGYQLKRGQWCTCVPDPKYTFFWTVVGEWAHGWGCAYCRKVTQLG